MSLVGHGLRKRVTILVCYSTCARAWRRSESSIRPAARATSSSSPTRRCGPSRQRSTGGAAQARIDFENEGGETYICGNPPFTGTRKQTDEQKSDLQAVFSQYTTKWKNVDYVGAWLVKAAQYNGHSR